MARLHKLRRARQALSRFGAKREFFFVGNGEEENKKNPKNNHQARRDQFGHIAVCVCLCM